MIGKQLKILDESDLDKSILDKLDYAFLTHKGLFNTKIPWKYLWKTELNFAEELRKL